LCIPAKGKSGKGKSDGHGGLSLFNNTLEAGKKKRKSGPAGKTGAEADKTENGKKKQDCQVSPGPPTQPNVLRGGERIKDGPPGRLALFQGGKGKRPAEENGLGMGGRAGYTKSKKPLK